MKEKDEECSYKNMHMYNVYKHIWKYGLLDRGKKQINQHESQKHMYNQMEQPSYGRGVLKPSP